MGIKILFSDTKNNFAVMGNPSDVKYKILNLIMDKKKISISEIHKKIRDDKGKEYNYRTIWQHVNNLAKEDLIDLEKQEHETGKPVMAIWPSKNMKKLMKENKK